MKKLAKRFFYFLPFAVILAVLFSVLFYPAEKEEAPQEMRVLRLWNVDTFEGGKGSRTAFLRSVARRTEKKKRGLYILVSDYTAEGAESAYMSGERPDLISFGVGLSVFAESCQPLPYTFAGGMVGGSCLACPWCRGSYALYSLKEDFDLSRVALSQGGANLVEAAAALGGVTGEKAESNAAYVNFLSGKYTCLLGTQRDACRFAARGVTVYRKELPAYCDLYQYISVLSKERKEDCLAFVAELLSDEVQASVSALGMERAAGGTGQTISVFSDAAALKEFSGLVTADPASKNIEKFLKTI